MTDIHCHILPFVDDGSDSVEKSLEMLKDGLKQGVNKVICTPHLRGKAFNKTDEEIKAVFEDFKKEVERAEIPVEIYLGREITVYNGMIEDLKNGKFLSMAGSKFVLLEFPYETETDVEEICYNVKLLGLVPIVAHVERYSYLRDCESILRLRQLGAIIQINASTLIEKVFPKERKFVKKLLKLRYVDIVASDYHYVRKNCMAEAYAKVKSKYKDYADLIFDVNPTYIATCNNLTK